MSEEGACAEATSQKAVQAKRRGQAFLRAKERSRTASDWGPGVPGLCSTKAVLAALMRTVMRGPSTESGRWTGHCRI